MFCWLGSYNRRTPSYFCHSSRMRSDRISCLFELPYTSTIACCLFLPLWQLVASTMSHRKVQIINLGPFLTIASVHQIIVWCVYLIQDPTPMSAYCTTARLTPASRYRTPSKDSLLVAWVPGVQWMILIVLGWHLASFHSWKSRNMPRNADVSALLYGRWAVPSQTARLLVQVRVQGEGEAKVPSFIAYQVNIGHLSCESRGRDRLIPSHS